LQPVVITRGSLFAVTVCIASAVHAEFAWEVAGVVRQAERGEFFETDGAALAATHFFDPVEDNVGPYALAAFLDPATRMTLAFSDEERTLSAELQAGQLIESERSLRDWSIEGQYLLPESKWYFGGRYTDAEIDLPSGTSITEDATGYGALAGKYFGGGATRLELALDRSTAESQVTTQLCFFGICSIPRTTTLESTADTARIGVMHVRQGRTLTYALFGDVAETQVDVAVVVPPPPAGVTPFPPAGVTPLPPIAILEPPGGISAAGVELEPRRTYSVGAELFPTRKLGVRIGYTVMDAESADDDVYDIGATWFFRRNVGVGLTLSRQEFDYNLPSSDSAAFRVIGRL
jgi:hypothetical protein